MNDHLHQALGHIEHQLKDLERAVSRGATRDRHFEEHFRRQQALLEATVTLLQEILRAIRQQPRVFPATSGISIRPTS